MIELQDLIGECPHRINPDAIAYYHNQAGYDAPGTYLELVSGTEFTVRESYNEIVAIINKYETQQEPNSE